MKKWQKNPWCVTLCTKPYLEDLKEDYRWASKQSKTFDWDNSSIVIHCWW